MRLAVPIKFKRMHENAVIPQYATPGSACVDLVATEIIYEDENKVTVKFGFAAQIPEGYKVFIAPRSSFTHKSWFMANSPGQIDSDYRGEWMAKFEAVPVGLRDGMNTIGPLVYEEFPYKVGDRVVQSSVEVNIHMKFIEVEDLEDSIRGKGGFGHTGK
jgi:dUTP pyrophosphatase